MGGKETVDGTEKVGGKEGVEENPAGEEVGDFRVKTGVRNNGVAGGLRPPGFRLQLVGHLLGCNLHLVLLVRHQHVVLVVEVVEEGGEK